MSLSDPAIIVGSVFLYMSLFYLTAQVKSDYSVVDIAWGLGFVLVGSLSLALAPKVTARGIIATSLTAIWGLRLGYHIGSRNWGAEEDFRYQEMRENWGDRAYIISYFRIFLLQGVLMLVISYPLILVNYFTKPGLYFLDYIGIAIWVLGFGFEAIGDYQLNQFIKNRKSKENGIMTDGLWRYTRHPNYFGEALLWWGIYLLTFSVSYGWAGFISPITIGYLLFFVSGVPLMEEHYADEEDYQKNAEKTNKFFPWLPKE